MFRKSLRSASKIICVPFVLLGVGLFHQSAPELAALCRVHKQQLPVFNRQPVVNHHINPLTKLPELQKEREKEREREIVSYKVTTTTRWQNVSHLWNYRTQTVHIHACSGKHTHTNTHPSELPLYLHCDETSTQMNIK